VTAAVTTAVTLTLTLTLTLTSCDLGQPGSFTARAEKYCAQATRTLAADTPVTDPVAYATDRFAAIDRVLVTERGHPALRVDRAGPSLAQGRPARPGHPAARRRHADGAANPGVHGRGPGR
jgi:hypothetical protein